MPKKNRTVPVQGSPLAGKPITFDRSPHGGTPEFPGGQIAVIRAATWYDVVTAVFGRSSGKTSCLPFLLVQEAGEHKGPYSFAYCAPTQRLARKQYRAWKQIFGPVLDGSRGLQNGCSDVDMIHHIAAFGTNDGVVVEFWGLDEYDNLRGDRMNRIVVDECKDVHPEAVYATLMPMLLGREGRILFIGTPSRIGKGASWFKAEYWKGQDHQNYPTHYSMRFPSHCNPYLSDKDLLALREMCEDEKTYREEILAEFLEDDFSVFENLSNVFSIPVLRQESQNLWVGEEPDEGGTEYGPASYAIGCDFAVSPVGDYSCYSVFNCVTLKQAALMRLHGVPYSVQLGLIHDLRERYNGASIYFDATGGHGVTMSEELCTRYGDAAHPIVWSSTTKQADIARAKLLCQRATESRSGPGWHLINVPWQRSEWETYQVVTQSSTGAPLHTPKYGAPIGMHDDSITASAILSSWLLLNHRPAEVKPEGPKPWTGEWIQRKVRGALRMKALRSWTSDS